MSSNVQHPIRDHGPSPHHEAPSDPAGKFMHSHSTMGGGAPLKNINNHHVNARRRDSKPSKSPTSTSSTTTTTTTTPITKSKSNSQSQSCSTAPAPLSILHPYPYPISSPSSQTRNGGNVKSKKRCRDSFESASANINGSLKRQRRKLSPTSSSASSISSRSASGVHSNPSSPLSPLAPRNRTHNGLSTASSMKSSLPALSPEPRSIDHSQSEPVQNTKSRSLRHLLPTKVSSKSVPAIKTLIKPEGVSLAPIRPLKASKTYSKAPSPRSGVKSLSKALSTSSLSPRNRRKSNIKKAPPKGEKAKNAPRPKAKNNNNTKNRKSRARNRRTANDGWSDTEGSYNEDDDEYVPPKRRIRRNRSSGGNASSNVSSSKRSSRRSSRGAGGSSSSSGSSAESDHSRNTLDSDTPSGYRMLNWRKNQVATPGFITLEDTATPSSTSININSRSKLDQIEDTSNAAYFYRHYRAEAREKLFYEELFESRMKHQQILEEKEKRRKKKQKGGRKSNGNRNRKKASNSTSSNGETTSDGGTHCQGKEDSVDSIDLALPKLPKGPWSYKLGPEYDLRPEVPSNVLNEPVFNYTNPVSLEELKRKRECNQNQNTQNTQGAPDVKDSQQSTTNIANGNLWKMPSHLIRRTDYGNMGNIKISMRSNGSRSPSPIKRRKIGTVKNKAEDKRNGMRSTGNETLKMNDKENVNGAIKGTKEKGTSGRKENGETPTAEELRKQELIKLYLKMKEKQKMQKQCSKKEKKKKRKKEDGDGRDGNRNGNKKQKTMSGPVDVRTILHKK